MGVVFAARGPQGGPVALKLCLSNNPQRFLREIRLQQALGEEDGFVPLLDSGTCDWGSVVRPYLVMPLLAGTLADRLREGEPLPADDARQLVAALAEALAKAHAQGIVHRDVKPDNVLFTAEGTPLVADLGLAKHMADAPGASQSVGLSRTGEARGTAAYMAPEQLNDAKRADARSDVFSLAAVLYHCLSGVPPYQASSLAELLGKVATAPPRPLRRVAPHCPSWLAAVCDRALSYDPQRRPADGAALAAALAGPPAATRPTGAVTSLALLALLAAGVGLALASRSPEPAPPPAATVPTTSPTPASTRDATPDDPGLAAAAAPPPSLPSVRAADDSRLQVAAVYGDGRGVHGATVQDVARLDADRVASCGADGRIRLWSLDDGEQVGVLRGHQAMVRRLEAFSDGTALLSASDDGELRRWSGRDLTRSTVVAADLGKVRGLSLTPDEAALLVTSQDGHVRLLQLSDGRVLWQQRVPASTLWQGAVAGAKRAVVVGDHKGPSVVVLLDLTTGEELDRKPLGERWGFGLAVTPDGQTVVAGSWDRRVRAFAVGPQGLEERLSLQGSVGVSAMAVTPDGRHALTAGNKGRIALIDLAAQREEAAYTLHRKTVFGVTFARGGTHAVTAGLDEQVRLTRLEDGEPGWPAPTAHAGRVVALAPAGAAVLSAGDERILRWEPSQSVPKASLLRELGGHLRLGAFGPGLFAGVQNNMTTLHRLDGEPHRSLGWASNKDPTALWWSGTQLSGGTEAGKPWWFPLAAAKPWLPEQGHDGAILVATASTDGRLLVTGGADAVLHAWDNSDGRQVMSLRGHASSLRGAAFVPKTDLPRLLALDASGEVILWDMLSGEPVDVSLPKLEAPGTALAVDLQGALYATADEGGAIRLWDLRGGDEIGRVDLETGDDWALQLAFTWKGETLLAGSARGRVLVLSIQR
jgi:WD40 repeat protein